MVSMLVYLLALLVCLVAQALALPLAAGKI